MRDLVVRAGARVVGRQPNVGARRYYHTDLLGSTRAVVQGTTVVESYDADPWGLLLPGRTLGSGTKEGFTGKERDLESGMDYFGARYYLPALGRWAAVDPAAAVLEEWSPYAYVLNNPVAEADIGGAIPPSKLWKLAKAIYRGVTLPPRLRITFSRSGRSRTPTRRGWRGYGRGRNWRSRRSRQWTSVM